MLQLLETGWKMESQGSAFGVRKGKAFIGFHDEGMEDDSMVFLRDDIGNPAWFRADCISIDMDSDEIHICFVNWEE